MNKTEVHNTRENRIITLFTAPLGRLQLFSRFYALIFVVSLVALILGGIIYANVREVESKKPQEITFGVEQSVNIFPAKVRSEDWVAVDEVFSQDLSDASLYQEFSAENAAFIPRSESERREAEGVQIIDTTVPSNTDYFPPEGSVSEVVDETTSGGEMEANPVSAEPEPTPEPEPASSVEVETTSFDWSIPDASNMLFPLAQLTMTSSTEADLSPEPEQVSTTEVVEEPVLETDVHTEDAASVLDGALASSSEESAPTGPVHEIVLEDFGTAPLERGQFVSNMQLRLSFAAKLKAPATEQAPYIEVLFGTATSVVSVGNILVDDEVSNALNGGYYLFALPEDIDVGQLADAKVIIRYHGDVEAIDGVFLDSAWLELDTRIITKEDLLARGVAEKLQHLETPVASVLLSDQLNFARGEKPLFNLRYESQRNFLVRGFRSLLNRPLVEVEAVAVNHLAMGLVGVTPNVSVTKDGLVSLEIPEEELTKMRPGSYEMVLTFNEGGKEFTDTFNFQWGILSINPIQSEYQVGDTAKIAIGALTPNGHTICHGNLDLYVTDPAGFITKVPVNESGQCNGNNVIDVPDFSAELPVVLSGAYELYLERLDDEGNVIGFTNDTFNAVNPQKYSIARNGPTRIYPVAPYEMELTIESTDGFRGVVTERVPAEFEIASTSADIRTDGAWKVLSWNVSIPAGGQKTVSYGFDAPDLSPYLYNLGPASLEEGVKLTTEIVASTTASTTEERVVSSGGGEVFKEHRQWQIASDAVGNMILYWDNASSIPTGWTCLSCGSGTFYQKFGMGSSTYNTTGGATTHTHSGTGSVLATSDITTENTGTGGIAIGTHTHTYTPTIASASNLPSYRNLRVIQYTAAAGEPPSLPTGAIGIFDAAVPSGWTRYSAQDGYYIYGENTPGTTGGSNTHTHAISGTTGAAAGGSYQSRGPDAANGSTPTHTHTVSGATASQSNEPRYVEVILGKLNATSTAPNGLISMWTEDVDGGWLDVSSANGDPFNQRFLKASTTYGGTGGVNAHAPTDVNGLTSSAPSATVASARSGLGGASDVHTHSVNVTSFSTTSNLPPYLTVVFGKRQGTNPVYEQTSSRWYVNANNVTPTDPWPSGGTDLAEKAAITASTIPVKDTEIVRLRMNVKVTNATSTSGTGFKLQYAATATCSSGTWTDVGTATSSAIWRGYNNTSATDGSTLASNLLASSTVSETYEENGRASSTPSDIDIDDYGEWDFVLQHNGAAAGTNYCFRIVQTDGTVFATYTHYPQLYTNDSPNQPVLTKPFDNEKTASSTPWFEFYATDVESNKVHYEIEIDNNYDFSSPTHDLDTLNTSEDDYFENQVLISDKAPFIQSDLIRVALPSGLTNGTTYYWRVRAQDPEGSADWGDWSTIQSVTIDTSLTVSAWFQTQDEQFDSNTLSGVQTGSNQVVLRSGSTTGSMIGTAIDFDDGDYGTAWGSLAFSDTETTGDLKYQIQYLNPGDVWTTIPDSALSGNSTGFDTSPVSLLDLDTNTYNQIRIVANFTNSGGSPSLQDWTVSWGYRVEIPTISMPFANEQVGTTTPTFEFTTTDPQNDSLTYQISWSTTPDFTSSTTRTSGVNAGFTNVDFGADTDPFISGDTIQFKIQTADALTGTTTYWWRVRAKDTTGANTYSFWTEEQSFTVIPGTSVSTWFQTTEEQFDTNILSGTRSLATDVMAVATSASEAMLVYGEGTQTEPRFRLWDGSAWGAEDTMSDVGAPVRWAVVRAATTREEYVAATVGSDADVNVQVYSTGAWGNLQEMTTNMGSVAARGFDVAYETLSGDAMVAYCDGDADPSYYIWNGSTWTSGGTINLASASNCEWIQLASDPVSDEIIILSRDTTGGQYEAQVWSGSAWGNSSVQGSVVDAAHEGMAVMYEESGGQALIVTSDGNPARFRWNSWSGSAWAGAATVTLGDDLEWAKMVRDEGSDEILLCYQDEDSASGVVQWSGSAWGAFSELLADGTANNKAEPGFDCVFEDTSGRSNYNITTMSNTTQMSYFTWNNTAWSSAAQVDTVGDSSTMQLIRTGVAGVLGLFYDDPADALVFSSWNGTAWSTNSTLESDMPLASAPFGQPYFMAPRNDGREGTTVVSPAIDFNDGTGPYWKTFSWNDTTPGSSDILYHLQYQNASGTWAFIPNTALSGNVAGFTTSPIDLSGLNTNTYNVIRPYAELTCDGSNNCPTLSDWKIEWAGGINIAGTARQYDESTNVTSGTVSVAVNGVLQTGKTGSISGGNWTISNVTAFEGDVITVFVSSAADTNEAVAVTRYDGQGDVSGMSLFERHLALGSNDATTTPMTNADIGFYDFTNSEDLFFNVTSGVLTMCADAGCSDATLYVKSGTYYTPGGRFVTHDFENNGIFTAGSYTHEINGSWDNNATTTMSGSTVVFAATTGTETIDNTGAPSIAFNNVTLGTTTGSASWTLGSTLDVNGNFTVARGTFARGSTAITVAGNLSNEANGSWTGIGTTTFDGNTAATWRDLNGTLQNVGRVVVDGTSKIVTLAGNVAAQSITIGANDTLDASTSNYDITVYTNWNNQNNFVARSGEVFFAATTTSKTITTTGDAFYDLTFSGSGGGWAFTESTVLVNNDLKVQNGTVTFPTATTTVGGSFTVSGGTWQHNNGVMNFTSGSAETLTFLGGTFTNVGYNLTFNGAGSWTVTDTNATSTNDIRVLQGTLNFPSGVFAVGGTLVDGGGTYAGGTGTVRFYSSAAEVLTAGGSSFNRVVFDGAGSWSFSDSTAAATDDLIVLQGTLTMPSGTFSIGGSYDNNATVTPGTGTVLFNSSDAGETLAFGSSALYNVWFNNASGGWTITENATSTNNFSITSASSLTLDSGRILSVGAAFTNGVGGAATTWTGSTLALRAGTYSINTKTNSGDAYNVLAISASTKISMWNSSAATYNVNATGSLYSQDHNAVDGDLYIFGAYTKTGGSEYWSYATDFDGTALGTTSRQVDVRFASGASASFTGTTLQVTGISTASTTVDNQGSGTYTVTATGGSVSANYYDFANLGGAGLSLLGAVSVPTLDYGSFGVGANGASAITLSSTTIDASPSKQLYYVRFATSTAISANNVSQTDGTPTSFWWFREGYGNLYGENYDNDTGNPGSVRFDDSSLVLTISGTVYSDAGITPIIGGTCDGSTQVVRVVVNGGTSYTGSCSNVDGSYSIGGVIVVGDPTLTVYLDNASGGQKGSVITRTPTADITDMDIYANRVIVRHEDVTPATIENLSVYDNSDDTDLRFTAATTSADTLTVLAGNELYVNATSTFTPGGVVTLAGNAAVSGYDGTLYLANGATFNAYATSTLTVGGRFVLESSATFNAASTTVLMNATSSGKSISSPSTITFNELTFNGAGGTWNLGANIIANGNINITAGTVTGTGNINLPNGSLSGNGILSLGAGTTTIDRSNTLGGTSAWTFYNLKLGSGLVVGTTTPVSSATTTIAGRLTISAAHFLDAGATNWDFSGTGTVFVETGTFLEDTSTVRYSGSGSNVLSTTYYNLDINAGAGSQTYTATGLGIIVGNNLTIGGQSNSTFNLTASDPALDVNGSVTIRSNGTLSASDTGVFTIGGSYTNDGTFTGNGGTVTFDGSGTIGIAAGNSSFSTVHVNATGAVTVSEHATSTGNFTLRNASSFTVASDQALAVGGTFFNAVGGGATTWTGSTLRLTSNTSFSLNAATTSDSYATLSVDGTTQARMWNSDAATYDIDSTASLYSQDHANVAGDLNIYGAYRNTAGADYWSYAYDFDGTALGGGARKVDVFFASGASALYAGGSLFVHGASAASTTLQNQGSGTYAITIGGTASTSWQYYEVTDTNSSGLVFTGTPSVTTLSFGSFAVSQNGGSGMTVGGTAINQNPAKNFTKNRFFLDGVGSGNNVTATGTSVSAWRFANHYGDIDGESFDADPGGDPGYAAWDDSAALITISGTVYSDEGSTVSGVCDGTTNNIVLRVAGITSYTTSCNATTGLYTISNVAYGTTDSLVVYIDGETEKGATVTQEPVSSIGDLSIYENRVIVRHEGTNALTIDDMAVWDSSDDADILFTAVSGSPDTLTLPANRKLIVWSGKNFAPGGNVTLAGAGAGAAYDGTLELYSNADWTGAGTEALSVGGSLILNAGADFTTANGTTTFTTTGANRTIDLNQDALHHVAFTGSGSWTISDATFTANGNVSQTAGTLDLPTGTSTFNGSFVKTGGTFDANGGIAYFTGSGVVRMGGSNFATTTFSGTTYAMTDTNATSTGSVTIESGAVTFPSGSYAIGGSLLNTGGAITHNNSRVALTSAVPATLLASSSDLFAIDFRGGGAFTMADTGITFLDDFIVSGGSSVALASGTISVGGSLTATAGTFTNATTTFLFNSADAGETINPGANEFYAVQVSAPTGGYTLTGSATTTHNFTLASASSFATQSGVTLRVEGVFSNTVGGAATNWNGSTLVLDGANAYTLNTKASGGDRYNTLIVGANSDIRMWNSSATTTTVAASASLYSQDHGNLTGSTDGLLHVYGDFHVSTSTEYWSYARDFDGASLSGSEREVTVLVAQNATTTVDGGSLQIVGASTFETTITNQGSGTYAFTVSSGTFNAQYYAFRNLNTTGLNLTGTPVITSLSYGDYELAVNNGSLITLSSTTLNANASKIITGARFATSSAITGKNVTLTGATSNAWSFTSHTGNLDGEAYDDDGITACGSIRWNDSSCLITQQTHYRWRNDDGATGVPSSEWYDADWDARKSVRIDNVDASSYTNAVVQMFVDYDSDMQADFEDLRFTEDDGTTVIPHWIGSSTDSTRAEVWVKVPSLPSEGSATVYMYYNNPTATSSASVDDTFIAADDFEDDDIAEYSGQTGLFNVGTSLAYDGTYGLDNAGQTTSRANTGGIYRTDQVVSQGETFRWTQYVDTTGTSDESCTKFGVQTVNQNYAVCVELAGTDRIVLVENAVENDSSGGAITHDTANITFTTGWYEFEAKWASGGVITVSLYSAAGTLVDTLSATDTSYSSGGLGFTFWYHKGGWDSVSSRPTLTTEPTVYFGGEQSDGGASWKTTQDTLGIYDVSDIARLRVAIENSGLAITNQQMLLEYAALGAAPSCEAVNPSSYAAVPVQASCGTSPVCMQSSSYVTNGASIADLLTGTAGTFTTGQLREDPSNITTNMNIGQDQYTEIEYVLTPTINTVDQNLCFRVTNNGTEFDTYLSVAQLRLRFDPALTNVTLNDGYDISLLPGTTTRVYATGTVTDLNGAGDLKQATSTIYRSGVSGASSCTPNNNDCYRSSCTFTNCAGNSCTVSCYADVYYHADATASSSAYEGEEWLAFVEAIDYNAGYDFADSIGQELDILRAISVDGGISYGALYASSTSGSTNASTSVQNYGNIAIDLEVIGTDMSDGASSIIPAYEQRFATSSFTYNTCTSCTALSSTTPYELDVELDKPTTAIPPTEDDIFWGVRIPYGVNSAPHTGMNVFTPISP
ncbi:MAG: hypothetical protein RL538_192 [Candidatus Parcubacteria bacterium]